MATDEDDDDERGSDNADLWPDVPRSCFAPGPWPLNACVGWVLSRPHELDGYATGYRRAACVLFDTAIKTNMSPDYTVFPLVFLWRHHLELSLKDIIATGRQIAGEKWGFPAGHDLWKLWKEARPYAEDCGTDGSPEIVNVEATIQELQKIDPSSDGFRYPLNVKLTGVALQNAPEWVNLLTFHEAMLAVSNLLSGVRASLGNRLDYIAENESR